MGSIFGATPLELHAPTAFEKAINYSGGGQTIHGANGRAIVLGSDIFYSPNCSRTPSPPPPRPITAYIRDPLKDSVEEFHQPKWWSLEAGYLPFLPTSPNFYCPPFHVLFNDLIGTGARKRRVRMHSSDVLSWKRLENALAQIFQNFQSNYSIPDMPPIVQTSLACQSEFEYPSQFTTAETRCRSWFSVWMAMVSLGIAVAQVSDCESEGEPGLVPRWYRTFARYVDEHTMSGIRQQVGQFGAAYPRAGVFIDLKPSSGPQVQPTAEFFVRYGIPVWYLWGSAEEAMARRNPSYWGKYTPPSHLLQRAHSYTIPRAPAPATAATSDHDNGPWESFFAERRRRATGPMPTKKPTLKVFHWERDSLGQWTRTRVVRRMQQEILGDYGKAQKKFDERSNEWDCCTEMGQLDAEEMQAADWENSDDEPILPLGVRPAVTTSVIAEPIPPIQTSVFFENDGVASSSSASGISRAAPRTVDLGTIPDGSMLEEHSPAEILWLFFGFVVPPPSVRLRLSPPSEQQVKDLASGIGFVAVDAFQEFVRTEVGKYAANFFWSMAQTPWVPPSNVLYDLASGNPRSLRNSPRLKYLRQLPGSIYMFDFRGGSTVDWKIAVRNITDILFILRLDANLNDYDIARELLNRGMPFLTLLPQVVPRSVISPSPKALRRLRFSDYSFGPADYASYCLERDELLRNPRVARQALKRGGIIWRLATDVASFQDVLGGPSVIATLQHCGTVYSDANANTLWIDDVLDPTEEDILSGVYYVYTGNPPYIWPTNALLITLS